MNLFKKAVEETLAREPTVAFTGEETAEAGENSGRQPVNTRRKRRSARESTAQMLAKK